MMRWNSSKETLSDAFVSNISNAVRYRASGEHSTASRKTSLTTRHLDVSRKFKITQKFEMTSLRFSVMKAVSDAKHVV